MTPLLVRYDWQDTYTKETCPDCGGTGKATCHMCGGSGKSHFPIPGSAPERSYDGPCLHCDGTGKGSCGRCHGRGTITHITRIWELEERKR